MRVHDDSPATDGAGRAAPSGRGRASQEPAHHDFANPQQAGSRAARQQQIAEVVATAPVRSQAQLLRILTAKGISITQATLSRDLDDMGAVRIRQGNGPLLYALPSEGGDRTPHLPEAGIAASVESNARLQRVASELLVSAQANDNLVVVRTPPGAAQFLASAIDAATRPDVLGTVAGDDTILIIAKKSNGGKQLAKDLMSLVKRRS